MHKNSKIYFFQKSGINQGTAKLPGACAGVKHQRVGELGSQFSSLIPAALSLLPCGLESQTVISENYLPHSPRKAQMPLSSPKPLLTGLSLLGLIGSSLQSSFLGCLYLISLRIGSVQTVSYLRHISKTTGAA